MHLHHGHGWTIHCRNESMFISVPTKMNMSNIHKKLTNDLCERLLLVLIAVEPIARFFSPRFIRFMTSIVDFTGCNVASGRAKPLSLIQLRISNLLIVKKPTFQNNISRNRKKVHFPKSSKPSNE